MADADSKTTKVAILGGGISALTAAFELTEHDPDSSYDITVYTLGWRLGGKAAVGRDTSCYDRAYEHGLHIWAGFYDNAFDVVKRLYGAARRGSGRVEISVSRRSTTSRSWRASTTSGSPG